MKAILNKLFQHQRLTEQEAFDILIEIGKGQHNDAHIASFMTVFLMRPITVSELSGFRKALLSLAVKVDLQGMQTIDLCGTGGDGKNTFNISTLTSFVVAGTGIKVTKHGNYGVSSSSGSSNMLEAMGYQFTNDASVLKKQLEEASICFFHAPLFHPAMKNVGPVRKQLALKTFFNLLGPLVNPCQPSHQLVGVYHLSVARLYKQILDKAGTKFGIVHALDGYDEISLTGDFKYFQKEKETMSGPRVLGLKKVSPEAIYGGNNVAEAAQIFKDILSGNGTDAQNSVVLTNAAYAIQLVESHLNFESAYAKANESLRSGAAHNCLKRLIENS